MKNAQQVLPDSRLAAYLDQQTLFYRHYVGMADAMDDRRDDYGATESLQYLSRAADVLADMQAVTAAPYQHDLFIYE